MGLFGSLFGTKKVSGKKRKAVSEDVDVKASKKSAKKPAKPVDKKLEKKK